MQSKLIKTGFISEISFDNARSELTIKFRSGSRFRYYGIDYKEYSKLEKSINIGGYYTKYIKGRYPGKRLESNQA